MRKRLVIAALLLAVAAAIGVLIAVRQAAPPVTPHPAAAQPPLRQVAAPTAGAGARNDAEAEPSRGGFRRLGSRAERERLVASIERALAARRAAGRPTGRGGGEDEVGESESELGSLSKETIREAVHAVIGIVWGWRPRSPAPH